MIRVKQALASVARWTAARRKLPTMRERATYARTVFDVTMSEHPSTRHLFRMWTLDPSMPRRTRLYEQMRRAAFGHVELAEVFRLRERAVGDLELATHLCRRAA